MSPENTCISMVIHAATRCALICPCFARFQRGNSLSAVTSKKKKEIRLIPVPPRQLHPPTSRSSPVPNKTSSADANATSSGSTRREPVTLYRGKTFTRSSESARSSRCG
ncbi:hypothetical protein CCM_04219 [Cordyceps militaris CM01]|uniref:Uncharacterized protein n=1 Tax=Cordyceps militaris (strain CM01) TaxID=983644 RepID=G3JE22_CORMM|nr:uncharacterized protein CCM_04219 [Cordyceps militaris CM01]EGX92847.1 hypothetical protein CCM_04219 [Cordyceps militaris CM01]